METEKLSTPEKVKLWYQVTSELFEIPSGFFGDLNLKLRAGKVYHAEAHRSLDVRAFESVDLGL